MILYGLKIGISISLVIFFISSSCLNNRLHNSLKIPSFCMQNSLQSMVKGHIPELMCALEGSG